MLSYAPDKVVAWFTDYDVEYIFRHDISEQFGALSEVFLSKLGAVLSDGWSLRSLSKAFNNGGNRSYDKWMKEQCDKARDEAPAEPDGVKVLEACASRGLKNMLRDMEPRIPEDSNE